MQSLWRKLGFLLTALALSIAFCLPARAYQEQSSSESPTHITEYKAYMTALDAGDREAAARHSEAAWEAAEQALGDHQLTAILAFNYAQLVFMSNPEGALVALQRADALVQMGLVELPQTELRLYMAYAEYAISDFGRREARALREALMAWETLNPDNMTMDEASIWFRLAQGDMKRKKYRRAIEATDRAEAIINRLDPDNINFMARVLLIRGVAKLMPTPLSTDDIIEAHFDLDRAYRLPPPQKDFESFDPTFARIIAWYATTYSVMASMTKYEALKGSGDGPRPVFETDIDAPEDCGIAWESRTPPKYPRKELWKGYIGAVIIIFDISDTGNILTPRILSEVPAEKFSDIVLESVENWRIKTMPIDHPGCRKNQLTEFAFVLSQ